jgi:two-component system osmolarity sensor histidine kinase EnvZ
MTAAAPDRPHATSQPTGLRAILRALGVPFRPLKRIMPKTLFGRAVLILLIPMVLIQAIVTYIFFERHWELVTNRLSASVAGDIAMIIRLHEHYPMAELDTLGRLAHDTMRLSIAYHPGQKLPDAERTAFFSVLDRTLRRELAKRLDKPFWFDTTRYPNHVDIRVQLDGGVLRVIALRDQVFATSGHIFLIWMVASALVLIFVAIIFLRNQVRPIQRLAYVAESFGKGRAISDFKPSGATEVRAAAVAFLDMKNRIERHIHQRTEMLAGVSHDLRTPLTRLKLELAMMGDTPEIEAMKKDVVEMERMLDEYLAFARGQGGETAQRTDMTVFLSELVDDMRRKGAEIGLTVQGEIAVTVRRHALRRCLANLIENARAFGSRVAVTAHRRGRSIEILVDDDGPGIPEARREEAFRPFHRLDESRNQDKGGVGLGLAMARDIARGHGGELFLTTSPLGGLRAVLRLPV